MDSGKGVRQCAFGKQALRTDAGWRPRPSALSPLSLRTSLGQRSAHSPTLTPQKPTGQACAEEGWQSPDRRWDGVTRWLISLTTPRAEHSSSSLLSVMEQAALISSRQEEWSTGGPRDQAHRGERVRAGPGLEASPPVTGEPHHSPHLRTDRGGAGGVAAGCHWLISQVQVSPPDQPEATDR